MVFSLSALSGIRIRGLWKLLVGREWKLPVWRDWLGGGGTWVVFWWVGHVSKSLVQFSVDGQDCVPSLLFAPPNYGGGNEDNGDFVHKAPYPPCCTQCPPPCSRLPPTHTSTRDSWTLTGMSGSVSYGVIGYWFKWLLVHNSTSQKFLNRWWLNSKLGVR